MSTMVSFILPDASVSWYPKVKSGHK